MMSDNKSCRVIDKNFTKIVQLWQTNIPDYKEDKELFVKLLDGDFDINYRIPCGNTSFQTDYMEDYTIFQLVFTDVDMSRALIDHGADFTVTDKKGCTILLTEVTKYDYRNYVDFTSMVKTCENSYRDLILSAHINAGNTKNPKDQNGLSHFHVACMYNRADAAKFFLENGVAVNETTKTDAKFYPGFSALHFAAMSCALETVALLLTLGADIFAQDSEGRNPLHILIVERRKTLIKLQKVLRMPPTDRENLYCSQFQEYCNINLKIIYLLLEKMKELGRTVDETGFSYFHVICFLGNTSEIQQFLSHNQDALGQCVKADSPVWPGYTPLHFAAHSDAETVELLVKKGADLGAKDAGGMTPFEICLKEFSIADIHRILLLQPDYYNIKFSESKTKLGNFIEAMQENTTFKTFLKSNLCRVNPNRFIPLDAPVCAGFTALHLVVACAEEPMNWSLKNHDLNYVLLADMASDKSQNYQTRIDHCLGYRTDVTIRDARGSTPIHWAFKMQQSQAVHLLFQRHESNSNPVDEHGLSHLHIACAAKNKTVIEKLLAGGANVNEAATLSYNWMDVDPGSRLGQLVQKYFINKCSTPLHFALSVKGHEIVKILIDHNADVLAKDADGFNPLERLFEVPIFRDSECPKPTRLMSFNFAENEMIKLLVKRIGEELVDAKPKQTLYCYSLLDADLLSRMLSEEDASMTKILESAGVTKLHVACFTQNLERVNKLTDEMNVNARVDSKSPLWPGHTPLHLLFLSYRRQVNQAILDKLLQSGADLMAKNDQGDTPIHRLFNWHWQLLPVTLTYLKDFSANPMGKAGYTHLHIACAYGTASMVEKLLEHGADVDYTADYFVEDFSGFTALHFAAFFQKDDVAKVLLKHGANVNKKNARGGNALHVANKEDRPAPCPELLQTLISAGADINLKDMCGETPLEALLKSRVRTLEEIKLFLSPHMHFHTFNLMTDEGFLAIALNRRAQIPIYETAIRASDVKNIDDDGRNAIHNIVSFKRPDWAELDDFMNEDAIDEKYTSSEDYILEIRSLMKLRLNIDKQDNKGSTPLHLAARMQNLTGIIGLLENGADINVTDSDGKPAFAYSFELAKIHEETNYDTGRKELRELDRRILKTILTHVYKLNLSGILISESTREAVAKMREIQSYDTSRIEKCMNEMEEMKEQQIDSTSVTFYEFLSDTGAVSNFPYFLSRQKTAIGGIFENNVGSLREKFPELTGILISQYRKALARCDVIDPATSSLKYLLNFGVTPNILKMVLRFFNNDELDKLISSTTSDE